MSTFDSMYLLDLHGSAKKGATAPDGTKDENVFDIEQGVAVGLFVRKQHSNREKNVYRADIYGSRESKYRTLWEEDISTTKWTEVKPKTPFYFYTEQNEELQPEYQSGWVTAKIFPVNSVGIQTARDAVTTEFTKDEIWQTVEDFAEMSEEEIRRTYPVRKDTKDWQVQLAKSDIVHSGPSKLKIIKNGYRIFDSRFTYYTGQTRGFQSRPRSQVMDNFIGVENIGLVSCRQTISEAWQHVSVCDSITDDCYISNKTKERGYNYPLYLYPNSDTDTLFDESTANPSGRRPNLSPEFVEDVLDRLKLEFINDAKGDLETTFGPEDVFHYIYAVLHSPTYRERYAEFLKIDFPRIPLTSDLELFRSLVALGAELVENHLLERTHNIGVRFEGEGDNVVDKIKFKADEGEATGQVYINKAQYFSGIPEDIYNFYIGGYQVLNKWLKDRKGRELDFDDLKHYQSIAGALSETMRLMNEVDGVIDGAGGFPLQ